MTVAATIPTPVLRPSDAVNLTDGTSDREYLSHSRIGILLACQRKYELHYERRLERVDRSEALEMGSAFHKAIEHRDPLVGYDEIMARADESLDVEGLQVQATIVKAAAGLYLERWVAGPRDGSSGWWEKPEVNIWQEMETREFEYRVRLRNPWTGAYSQTFDLKGYADGITRHETGSSARLSLTEAKLKSRITNTDVQRLPLDRQVTLACYGLWRATGLPVTEVNYRYVKKPAIRQKQGESLTQFLARIEEDYLERPDFYAHEESLYRTTEDLLRVECELWEWADMLRRMRRQKLYTRNTGACSDYGGCQFIPICSGQPDAHALYRIREESHV